MNKIITFLIFAFCFNQGFSQTEEEFIQNIKVFYAKNNKTKACDESKNGLSKFPNSTRIAKLQALVCSSINGGAATTEATTTGGTTSGGTTTTRGTTTGGTTTTRGTVVPEIKIVNVNTGFKRIIGQNRVEWSKSLSDNAVSLSIRYTVKGVGVLVDEQVTGRTYHIYDPGTSKAHGRSTKVELIVDYGDKKVNESGTLVLDNQFFVCSAN